MCGRYSITSLSGLDERFNAEFPDEPVHKRYNAAPSQKLIIIPESSPRKMEMAIWGFPILWMKDRPQGLINIRIETLRDKPSFKHYLENGRCLVIADGFYEWKKTMDGKVPYRITLKDGESFAFAGIYKEAEDGLRFAIITTEPNALMKNIHARMPVIFERNEEKDWLDDKTNFKTALGLALSPYPTSEMMAYEISKLVNKPENDSPAVIKPKIHLALKKAA